MQSVALLFGFAALLCNILTWNVLAVWCLMGTLGCIIKAMMYRERWEIDTRYNTWKQAIQEAENDL